MKISVVVACSVMLILMSTGVSVNMHYCQSSFIGAGIQKQSCGMSIGKRYGIHRTVLIGENCCKNESYTLRLYYNIAAWDLSLSSPPVVAVLPHVIPVAFLGHKFRREPRCNFYYRPPPNGEDLVVFYHQLLI